MKRKESWPRTYAVYGKRFQHKVTIDTNENLISQINSKDNLAPEYISKLCHVVINCKNELNDWAKPILPFGYEINAIDKSALLLINKG